MSSPLDDEVFKALSNQGEPMRNADLEAKMTVLVGSAIRRLIDSGKVRVGLDWKLEVVKSQEKKGSQ